MYLGLWHSVYVCVFGSMFERVCVFVGVRACVRECAHACVCLHACCRLVVCMHASVRVCVSCTYINIGVLCQSTCAYLFICGSWCR